MRDPRGDFGRIEGKAAHDQLSDNITFFRFMFRIVTVPIWFPFYLYRWWARRRRMIEFTQSLAVRGARDYKEVGVRWVLTHPAEYILGEYDPKLPRVQKTFRRIMAAQKRRLG